MTDETKRLRELAKSAFWLAVPDHEDQKRRRELLKALDTLEAQAAELRSVKNEAAESSAECRTWLQRARRAEAEKKRLWALIDKYGIGAGG